jgi:hypothetical protein
MFNSADTISVDKSTMNEIWALGKQIYVIMEWGLSPQGMYALNE